MKKYMKDMDITNIVNTIHQTRIMVDLLMDERQKELSKYSHVHTVEDDISDKSHLSGVLKYKYLKNLKRHEEYLQQNHGKILQQILTPKIYRFNRLFQRE